jgi:exonuclease SbcC
MDRLTTDPIATPAPPAMRLVRLQASNFRALQEVDVVFADGLMGLVGRNGTGKTSLLHALMFAWYGSDGIPYKKTSLPGPGTGDTSVELEFTLGARHYRVERSIRRRDFAIAAALFADGEELARGAEGVTAEVTRILGGHAELAISRFVGQKQLDALSALDPAPRKRLILRLLGVEGAEEAIGNLREQMSDFDRSIKARRGVLPDGGTIDARITEAEELVAALTAEGTNLALDIATADAAIVTARSVLAAIDLVADAAGAQRREVELLEGRLAAATEALAAKAGRRTEIADAPAELTRTEAAIAAAEAARGPFEAARAAAAAAASLAELAVTETRVAASLATAAAEVRRLDGIARNLPAFESELANAEAARAAAATEATAAEGERGELRAAHARAKTDVDAIFARLATLETATGGSCPTCGGTIADAAAFRAHVEADLAAGRAALAAITERGIAAKARAEAAETALATAVARTAAVTPKLDAARAAGAELRLARAEAERLTADLAAIRTDLTAGQGATVDRDALTLLERQVASIPALHGAKGALAANVRELALLDTEIGAFEAELAILRPQLASAVSGARAAGYDPDTHAAAKVALTDADAARGALRDQATAVDKSVALAGKDLEIALRDRSEHARIRTEIEALLADRGALEGARTAMEGFKTALIGRIRPALARKASLLLRELTEGRYADLALDEEYEVSIGVGGRMRPIRECSGGEQDLANLCLRLAISELVTESTGIGATFVVLDEVLGSQDEERRDAIMALLPRLGGHFGQILMVAHIPSVQDRFEQVIATEFDPITETSVVRWRPAGWTEPVPAAIPAAA